MTRGQETNRLHIVAADLNDAREQFTAVLERDRADRGLVAATQAAREAVAGLVPDGPVALVNAERTRLAERIERAEAQAGKWERALAALTRQAAEQQAERDRQEQIVAAADAHAAEVRAEVAAPLIEQATTDATAYLSARDRAWEARRDRDRAGPLRRRAAARAVQDADGALRATEDAARRRWGGVPQTDTRIPAWAEAAAVKQADADPQVIEARQDAEHAHLAQQQLTRAHMDARASLRRRIHGDQRPVDPAQRAAGWRTRAEQDRRDLAQIEALPIAEAAQLIRERAAQAEMERIAAEQTKAVAAARAAKLARFRSPSSDHRRSGPERDFGPSL